MFKKLIIILLITIGPFLSSCDKVIDIMVNDVPVTCVNNTNTDMKVYFTVTDYPFPTVWDIVTTNNLPIMTSVILKPSESKTTIIYCAERFDVWFAVYKLDDNTLYWTGKYQRKIVIE